MNRLRFLLVLLLCALVPAQSLARLAESGPSCRGDQPMAMPMPEDGAGGAMDCCDSAMPGGETCEHCQAGQHCAGGSPHVIGIPMSAASLPANGPFPYFVNAHPIFLPDPVSGIWRPPLPL